MLLKIKRKVDAWHHASSKKVTSHPVAWPPIDKFIGLISVTEDVHKELPLFAQPVRDAAKNLSVISKMFKHFNRYYPVKLGVNIKMIDVSSQNIEILKAAFGSAAQDVRAL